MKLNLRRQGLGLGISLRKRGVGGAAPATPFDPSTLMGATDYWWDASDSATLTNVSGKASAIADKSGNSNTLSQATDASRPLIGESFNGVACIDCRPNKFMTPAIDPFIYGAREVFAVLWSDRASTNDNAFVLAMPGGSTSNTTIGTAKTQFGNASVIGNAATRTNRTMRCTLIQHSYIGPAGSTTQYHRINGQLLSGSTTSASVFGTRIAFAANGAAAAPMNGLFAEMLVFNKELTAQNRTDILGYLSSKWASLTPVSKYHIVLVAGQSNARGAYGPVNRSEDLTDPRIAMLQRTYDPTTGIVIEDDAGPIVLAEHPLSNRWRDTATPPPEDSVGPGLAYAKALLATLPSDEGVLLVPCAQGATYIMPQPPLSPDITWAPVPTPPWTNPPFTDAVARTNRMIAAGHELHSIIWCQGENEAARPTMAEATYAGYLDDVVNGLRAQITSASSVPFIAIQIGSFLNGASYPNAANVNAAIADLPNRLANSAFVSNVGFASGGDNLHYSAAAARAIGDACWTAFGTI